MKTIGLIGGTGWVSTHEYYKIINEEINRKVGGLEFPRIILYSVNYGEIYACNQNEDREGVYEIIKKGAESLVNGGVDFMALCANTIHFTYPQLITEFNLPFVHIADATGEAIKKQGVNYPAPRVQGVYRKAKLFLLCSLRSHSILLSIHP